MGDWFAKLFSNLCIEFKNNTMEFIKNKILSMSEVVKALMNLKLEINVINNVINVFLVAKKIKVNNNQKREYVFPKYSEKQWRRTFSVYWVPQGKSCEIPVESDASSPKFVFTPDFSGCAILVNQISRERYCVYHIEVPHIEDQYKEDGPLVSALTFSDYGVENSMDKRQAVAFLKYEERRWWIYYQSILGCQFVLRNGKVDLSNKNSGNRIWKVGKFPVLRTNNRNNIRTKIKLNEDTEIVVDAPENFKQDMLRYKEEYLI